MTLPGLRVPLPIVVLGAVLLVSLVPRLALAQSAATAVPIARIAVEDSPPGTALEQLNAAGTLPVSLAVRVESLPAEAWPALEARLEALERRKLPIWLSVPAPGTADAVEGWRTALRGVLARRGASLIVLEVEIDQQTDDVARFAVQTAATELRATGSAARVALGGSAIVDPPRRASIYVADLSAYVDLLALPADDAAEVSAWLRTVDLHPGLALLPARSRPAGLSAVDTWIAGTIADLGSEVAIRAWPSADLAASTLHALAPLNTLLTHQISQLDDEAAGLTIGRGDTDVAREVPHRLLFDADTFSTYLTYQGQQSDQALSIGLTLSVEGTPAVSDVVTGERLAVTGYARDSTTGHVGMQVPQTGHLMLVDFNEGALPIGNRSEVSAERQLTVGEIIARHQQQQRAQDAVVQNYVAQARMEQHFRPTVADPGYDVVTENTYFSAGDGVEWEELSFSVNGSKWGADRPPFPLLQPEKVLALPLELRFDDGYRYRLSGFERIDGFDCYVIKFDPVRSDSSLYRGTVWIDRRTFARIRVQAVQNGLTAPVVSNEEIQHYAPATHIGTRPIFLFTGLTAHQIVLVAGRNLLVEKRVAFSDFRVNDPEFDQKRGAARESDRVMFRDTANGLRYYAKENGQRVVSDRPTLGVKALAMGLTLDPSYSFPLPILGINYIDFQFGRPDTQLAILFAGVLAAGNIQRSNFGAKNVDASLDFFAIAAPSGDRLYGAGGEDPRVRVLTWPLSTGLNIGWQATPFQKATLQYQFRFDGYVKDRTTSADFITPSSTVTNGFGGAWEYKRAGYSLVTNGAWFDRAGWRPWGEADATTATSASYIKYTAGLSRDFYLNAFQKLHFNGAWFGGRDLDRFVKYQFGMFDDTRIHGVPSSGVRFGELAMARGSYSVNIFEQYRVDFFVEHAWGRDDSEQVSWQRIPGIGLALNLRARWNTILRVDAGKSFLPARYDGLGSATLQIMLLKPLK